MEVPRIWRLRESRLGTSEGGLRGSICPVCGAKHFPSREGTVCPQCNWKLDSAHVPEIKNSLGAGVLCFTKENGVLNLVLFKEVCDAIDDLDTKKLERIFSSTSSDKFSQPRGLNTVTGKVEEVDLLDLEKLNQADPVLLKQATVSIKQEISEEAGIDLPEDRLSLLTSSEIVIDQFRGKYNEQQQPIINRFFILAFAALLSNEEFQELKKSSGREVQLFNASNISELEKVEVRKATKAILVFLSAALLWIAQLEDNAITEIKVTESVVKEINV